MATGSRVYAMVMSGNDLYVGGSFTEIAGVTRNRIAKLGTGVQGRLDMAWNPDADSHVTSLVLSETDGKLYAGGDFKNMGVLAAKMLAGNYLKIPKKLFNSAASCYCSWYFFSRYMKA